MSASTFSKVVFLFGIYSCLAYADTFELYPVSATVPHSIAVYPHEIVLRGLVPPDATILFDVRAHSWGPELMGAYQFSLDPAGFTSGTTGSIGPFHPQCTADQDCSSMVCWSSGGSCLVGGACSSACLNIIRSDSIFRDADSLVRNWAPSLATALVDSAEAVADPQTNKYLGSYRLEVSPDASGEFTLNFDGTMTHWQNENSEEFTPDFYPCAVKFFAGPPVTFELRPISANVQHTVSGNEIFLVDHLPDGAIITFDVLASGWSSELLQSYQFGLDAAGFSSGLAGSITPFNPACTSDAQCEGLLGPGANCLSGVVCGAAFLNALRPDFIFHGQVESDFYAGSAFGGASVPEVAAVADPGTARYLGSVQMQVSPDAAGTFTLDFLKDTASRSIWTAQDMAEFPLASTIPAKVTFDSVAAGVPAASTWGLVVLGLGIAVAGTIRAARMRPA